MPKTAGPRRCGARAARGDAGILARIRILSLVLGALLAFVIAPSVRAFEPFVVKDIRVEGVQRTEAGHDLLAICPSRSATVIDEAKAAQAVKALFATGFFRDVRLEAENGVLVVIVQERPTISKVDIRRQQGIRHRHAQEGAEGHRPRRGADLRPFGARSRRAGDEAAVHHPGQVRGAGHDHGDAAGAQPRRRSTSRSSKATPRRSRASTSSATRRSPKRELLGQMTLTTPGWLDLVHEERPVLEAEALGRPRDAAQLLPESRLPRVQRRIHAGLDHAGQGRHLHHGQRHRRRAVHGVRRAARRRSAGPGGGA